jgi:ribosome-associated translation inhibitor RaiA
MPIELQTTYRSFSPPTRADKRIRARLKALEQTYPDIRSCALTTEQYHGHQLRGVFYRVAIAITLASGEVISDHEHHNIHAHENLFVALEDAFDALEIALEAHVVDAKAAY